MRVTLWGTRGSIASPGPDTVRYGGNTSCVVAEADDGSRLVLDAGTGIRRLGHELARAGGRIDVLVTHLHLDHILGLGFFAPLYVPEREVHLWAPAGTTESLRARLTRYMSPPLFPVRLRDLPCALTLHEVPCGEVAIGGFVVSSALVCHPGPTVGYRVRADGRTLAYMPDHEPALGCPEFPRRPPAPEWTSGYAVAADVDLLIHDAQFSQPEYDDHVGWGHSSLEQTIAFATVCRVRRLVPFHHDPSHSDDEIERLTGEALARVDPPFGLALGAEGATFELD